MTHRDDGVRAGEASVRDDWRRAGGHAGAHAGEGGGGPAGDGAGEGAAIIPV